MNKKIFIASLLTMSFTAAIAAAPMGTIGFRGNIVVATEVLSIGPNSDIQTHHAATRVSSQLLTNTMPVRSVESADDLFEYFASYAPVSAKVVTVTYH